MKDVDPILLLPNSPLLRLFGVFDALKAGSDPLLKPKTQQSFEFGGVTIQASDVSSRMAAPFRASRTCPSPIRLPATTPEKGASLSGAPWRNVPEEFWLQPSSRLSSHSAIQQHGRECQLVERNSAPVYLTAI